MPALIARTIYEDEDWLFEAAKEMDTEDGQRWGRRRR
jgi:hypothetical protein